MMKSRLSTCREGMQRELSIDNEKLLGLDRVDVVTIRKHSVLLPLISTKHSKTDVGGRVAVALEYK